LIPLLMIELLYTDDTRIGVEDYEGRIQVA
jgi:hypothetical protein